LEITEVLLPIFLVAFDMSSKWRVASWLSRTGAGSKRGVIPLGDSLDLALPRAFAEDASLSLSIITY
jgi:hypothetical protein